MYFNTKKISDYFKILRLSNLIITFFSIYIAVFLSSKDQIYSMSAFFLASAGALIGSAGMIINDYFDIEIDRINKPKRPLPSGGISKTNALIYYIFLNLFSLVLLTQTRLTCFLLGLFSIIIIFLYSKNFKRSLIISNFIVAFMTALAFILGGSLSGNYTNIIFPAVFAFLINFAREILKDIVDEDGDRRYEVKSIPIIYGKKISLFITNLLLILVIILSIIPYFSGIFNIEYLLIILFCIDLPLVFIIKRLISDLSMTEIDKIHKWIKYLMMIGILSFIIGTI